MKRFHGIHDRSKPGFRSCHRVYQEGDTTMVYALVDPRTDEVRYVGKSDNPRGRLTAAILDAKRACKGPKHEWVRNVLSSGVEPIVRVLEEVNGRAWQHAEDRWMRHFLSLGHRLTNSRRGDADGGIWPWVTRHSDKSVTIDYEKMREIVGLGIDSV